MSRGSQVRQRSAAVAAESRAGAQLLEHFGLVHALRSRKLVAHVGDDAIHERLWQLVVLAVDEHLRWRPREATRCELSRSGRHSGRHSFAVGSGTLARRLAGGATTCRYVCDGCYGNHLLHVGAEVVEQLVAVPNEVCHHGEELRIERLAEELQHDRQRALPVGRG